MLNSAGKYYLKTSYKFNIGIIHIFITQILLMKSSNLKDRIFYIGFDNVGVDYLLYDIFKYNLSVNILERHERTLMKTCKEEKLALLIDQIIDLYTRESISGLVIQDSEMIRTPLLKFIPEILSVGTHIKIS